MRFPPSKSTCLSCMARNTGKRDIPWALPLSGTLDAASKGDKDRPIYLRADMMVPGELMEVMNLLRTAGYLKVALVGLEKASGP